MDLDRLARVLQQMEEIAQGHQDRFLEIDAALTAQRFLLEQLYANAFMESPADFSRLMGGLIDKTRSDATTAAPMEEDEKIERQARVATRLVRFEDSVNLRLKQG